MSLILDALKKSDNERKRQSSPSISDVRNAEKKPETPRWIFGFIALLIINLIVLVFVLTRGEKVSEPALPKVAIEEPEVAASIPPPDYSGARGEREAVRSLAAEVNPSASPPVAARSPAQDTPAPVTTSAPAAAATSQNDAAMERFSATDTRDLPTLASLRSNGAISLPELHIDLHVYNGDPARRLVFVNGTKYGEGQTLSEGPVVSAIRQDGVVLTHRGVEFLLPRE